MRPDRRGVRAARRLRRPEGERSAVRLHAGPSPAQAVRPGVRAQGARLSQERLPQGGLTMPRWLITDTITYERRWYVEAASEDEALDLAIGQGPNDTLEEEQVDNTPYAATVMED